MTKIIISADNSLCCMKELGFTAFIVIFAPTKSSCHERETGKYMEFCASSQIRCHFGKQFEEDSKLLKEISTNPEALEKVAREKYMMKKENEDIFIFEQDLEDE